RPASLKFASRLTAAEGFIETTDLEGRDALTRYRRSSLGSWHVLMWAPKSVLNGPLYWSLMVAVGLAVMTLLASIAAGLLAGRVVAKPIQQLLRAAQILE